MSDRRKKQYKGSITVEAAFLMPVLSFLLLTFLWMSFFLHDRAVISSTLQQFCRESADYLVYGRVPYTGVLAGGGAEHRGLLYAVTEKNERVQYLEMALQSRLNQKLYTMTLENTKIKKSGCYLEIKLQYAYAFPEWAGAFFSEKLLVSCESFQVFCPVREELTRMESILLDKKEKVREVENK